MLKYNDIYNYNLYLKKAAIHLIFYNNDNIYKKKIKEPIKEMPTIEAFHLLLKDLLDKSFKNKFNIIFNIIDKNLNIDFNVDMIYYEFNFKLIFDKIKKHDILFIKNKEIDTLKTIIDNQSLEIKKIIKRKNEIIKSKDIEIKELQKYKNCFDAILINLKKRYKNEVQNKHLYGISDPSFFYENNILSLVSCLDKHTKEYFLNLYSSLP